MSPQRVQRNTTEALFNIPESPDSSTCKPALQVAPNVEDIAIGQVVEGEYGPATLLSVEVSKWRFSEKPKHRLTFHDHNSGEEYIRSYFPWSPIKNNHAFEAVFSQ
ncbi:hypothetical protein [Paenarthrobacter ureafaciens]|uniref:hypothetical protein n=1 Tax=Paenarthrobacter ureafaciens TaxID=37931 RepID=UPI0009ADDB5C|nr:hypothetical protein [Paenarthrobacter ureafaciens]GLU58599.1 hypothetical protein Pure01_11120 [Paenarthrobacter ureafaciens]GLU61844.1 hypothetical protein Pure02_00940 [Paenarthrobacter ureafaciens]GLU66118.1 hypothetical protein Pure03_00940 [Paenarthrobacter ureafaciens]GLU71558.1 hypothetical protein Pure04_12730 [Paenarthrobacter ureafaciens]GLU74655.1 hypothetical protein Pure05_00950 [Paenarthrobacter ureafaciens]